MTDKKYFENHIPYRFNLLITFRARFADLSEEKRENVRDLFRCSKDISILMCRFFLEELGIKLLKGKYDLKPNNDNELAKRRVKFKITTIDIPSDKNLRDHIVRVLIAANRAVAHIDDIDVEHPIEKTDDEKSLVECINYIENCIRKNMYISSGYDFDEIMKMRDNNMHRDRLNLNT